MINSLGVFSSSPGGPWKKPNLIWIWIIFSGVESLDRSQDPQGSNRRKNHIHEKWFGPTDFRIEGMSSICHNKFRNHCN